MMSYIAIGFNVLAGLIYTPWMIKEIGQEDYGIYILAISLISIFSMDFGFGAAISRFLSKYIASDDKVGAERFLGISYKLFGLITLLIFITLSIIYFSIENIYSLLTVQEIEKLKVIFLISGSFILISFPTKPFEGILIASQKFIFLKLADLSQKILVVILMITALLLDYGLYALVIVNVVAGTIKVLITFIYLKKESTVKADFSLYKNEKKMYKEIIVFSSWATIVAVMQRLILNITPSILGAYAGSVHIAVFAVGLTIEGYIWMISAALGGLFSPKAETSALQ